jgi:hypothetical protein
MALGSTMRAPMFLLLALVSGHASAGSLGDADQDAFIADALQMFWGRARISDGSFVQPASETERETVPISRPMAYRVIEAGEISGVAEWCDIDWIPHFLSLTAAARRHGLNETQVAFVGFLHGMAQGDAIAAKSAQCSEADRANVIKKLAASMEQSLDEPNKRMETDV